MLQLSTEDKLILAAAKFQPTAAELEQLNALIPQITDWDYVRKNVIERGVGPLFYKKLSLLSNNSQIPDLVKRKVTHSYFRTLSRSVVLYDAFAKIAEAFNAVGIYFIALKGVYLCECLYGDIGLRQFSDIDILVKPEDGASSLEILSGLGYIAAVNENISDFIEKKSRKVHYRPMIMNEISVEVHTKLHRDTETYCMRPDACLENAVPVTIYKQPARALQLYDLLIHLCLHLDKHFREGVVQFTNFMDIATVVDLHSSDFNWSIFSERCRDFRCEQEVMKYIILVHKYLGVTLPENIYQLHAGLVTENDEYLFQQYLQGHTFKKQNKTAIPAHLENLKRIGSFVDFIKYMIHLLFPTRQFMCDKYRIKYPRLYFFYYPYRYYTGLKGVILILAGKHSERKKR